MSLGGGGRVQCLEKMGLYTLWVNRHIRTKNNNVNKNTDSVPHRQDRLFFFLPTPTQVTIHASLGSNSPEFYFQLDLFEKGKCQVFCGILAVDLIYRIATISDLNCTSL